MNYFFFGCINFRIKVEEEELKQLAQLTLIRQPPLADLTI